MANPACYQKKSLDCAMLSVRAKKITYVLLAITAILCMGLAGLADWEEHLVGKYYLSRGPSELQNKNVISVIRKTNPNNIGDNFVIGNFVISDVDPKYVVVHEIYILGVTSQEKAFLIDTEGHKLTRGQVRQIAALAAKRGIPWWERWRAYGTFKWVWPYKYILMFSIAIWGGAIIWYVIRTRKKFKRRSTSP